LVVAGVVAGVSVVVGLVVAASVVRRVVDVLVVDVLVVDVLVVDVLVVEAVVDGTDDGTDDGTEDGLEKTTAGGEVALLELEAVVDVVADVVADVGSTGVTVEASGATTEMVPETEVPLTPATTSVTMIGVSSATEMVTRKRAMPAASATSELRPALPIVTNASDPERKPETTISNGSPIVTVTGTVAFRFRLSAG
jgi:hypothetical protein